MSKPTGDNSSAFDGAPSSVPAARTYSYDVFLSYSSEDKEVVCELADRLKHDNLKVWLDKWIIKPGDMIPLVIQHGLQESRTMVVCMSRAFFDSAWATLEHHTLLFRDPTNGTRRFIPLLLETCNLPDVVAMFKHIDWRSPSDEGYKSLLRACKVGGLDPDGTDDGGSSPGHQQSVTSESTNRPLVVLEIADLEDFLEVGKVMKCVITVSNQGSADGTNIGITAQLPPEIEHVSSLGPTPGTNKDGQVRFAPLARLAPRARATYRVVGKAKTPGDVHFRVEMTSDQISQAPVQRTQRTRVLSRCTPDFALDVVDPEESIEVGEELTYIVRVTSQGTVDGSDVGVKAMLPPQLEFVSAQGPTTHSMHGGVVVFSPLPGMSPRATATFRVVTKATSSGEGLFTVELTCNEMLGWLKKTTKRAIVLVKRFPALLLEVVDVEDPIQIGQNMTYIITVTNQGSADDTNIVIKATLPPELDYVSAQGPTPGSVQGNVVSFAPLPHMAPRSKATYRVVTKASGTGDVRFVVEMTSSELSGPPVQESESSTIY